MAELKAKVESVIERVFPGSQHEIEEIPQIEKLSGYVAWDGFNDLTQRERHKLVLSSLRDNLQEDEARLLSIIMAFTPAEINALNKYS